MVARNRQRATSVAHHHHRHQLLQHPRAKCRRTRRSKSMSPNATRSIRKSRRTRCAAACRRHPSGSRGSWRWHGGSTPVQTCDIIRMEMRPARRLVARPVHADELDATVQFVAADGLGLDRLDHHVHEVAIEAAARAGHGLVVELGKQRRICMLHHPAPAVARRIPPATRRRTKAYQNPKGSEDSSRTRQAAGGTACGSGNPRAAAWAASLMRGAA